MSREPSFAGRPTAPTFTTSVPSTERCHGMPVWVHSSTSEPVRRSRSSSSESDSHRKSFTASGEPWTMCTSTPSISSRSSPGRSRIHAANSALVDALVWSYISWAKWLSRSEE